MEVGVFATDADVDATHWWYVGRRQLFASEIRRLGLPRDARILDIGTSAGTGLRMLGEMGFSRFEGLDPNPEAIRLCAERGFGAVHQGEICSIPFKERTFDLVLATDVIEHVDDDRAAVAEVARILAPGGAALFSVPTFPILWGRQDDVANHKRRYLKHQVVDLVRGAGLIPVRQYYFNYLLFLPILVARTAMRMFGAEVESESRVNTRMLNWVLRGIFTLDIKTAPYIRPPVGVSALVLARMPR